MEYRRRRRVVVDELKSQWVETALPFIRMTVEIALRMPAFLTIELWFRNQKSDSLVPDEWKEELIRNERVSSILAFANVLQFVRSRSLDESAAQILSFSVLFLCLLFVMLPLAKLVQVYLHAFCFLLMGVGHFLSTRYVQQEVEQRGEVILDDFVKLERHGFHLLAQVMVGLLVSCLLGLQSELARASLMIFCTSIIARMCGVPVDKLQVVHNFSASFAMLIIGCYLLNTTPLILRWIKGSFRQLEAEVTLRGPFDGVSTLWQRLNIPVQLSICWLLLFFVQVIQKFTKITTNDSEKLARMNPIFVALTLMAQMTSTPLTLLGLAFCVSYISSGALWTTNRLLGVSDVGDGSLLGAGGSGAFQGGYAEGLTLLLLSVQTGLLGMTTSQRAFLFGLVLFIVASALLQSVFDALEPQLLSLGASYSCRWGRHLRAWFIAAALLIGPFMMAYLIASLLPVDLWLLIIVSNCLLTSLQTATAFIVYLLFLCETHSREPWERLDDYVYWCRAVSRVLEFLLAIIVILFGVHESVFGRWSWISSAVLLFHCYFNVWRRLQAGWHSFQLRRQAAKSMELLARASEQQLQQHNGELCTICFTEMCVDVRVTPCSHLFHGGCLRKWLFVRQSCPLCHTELQLTTQRHPPRSPPHNQAESEEGYSSESANNTEDEAETADEGSQSS